MSKNSRLGLWTSVVWSVLVLVFSGCMTDKGANGDTPFEAARYAAMQAYLQDAFDQLCASYNDALEAQFETDTASIPALTWPFSIPARRHVGSNQPTDEDISWGVGYNVLSGTTRLFARWDLGRLADTGRLVFDSPLPASRVTHNLVYVRNDQFDEVEENWEANIHVNLNNLDEATATATSEFTAAHTISEQCGGLACDEIEIVITEGEISKAGGNFDAGTLAAVVNGTITLTEFDIILGHEAIYTWEISGTFSGGLANLTLSSGEFSETSTYSLCLGSND